MRFWADVFTYQNEKIGSAIRLTSVSVTRKLDGAGKFALSFSAADRATFDLLALERRVRIYLDQDGQKRLFGGGTIRDHVVTDNGRTVSVTGPDSLDDLQRKSVFLGRTYNNLPISSIAADLVSLVPGWSIEVTTDGIQSARFDGMSVNKALIRVAEENGSHIREGLDLFTLELGDFGEDSGVRALKPETITHELDSRDDLILIDKLTRTSTSREVVNFIVPIGAGEGAAALTLKNSTANQASEQYILAQDGVTKLYYRSDADSITAYGQIEKVLTFKEISVLINSVTGKQRAADALEVAADAWLVRNAWPKVTFSLGARKVRTFLRPGQKLHVQYKGVVPNESQEQVYIDVNDDFWLMAITETVNASGMSGQYEIASVDSRELDKSDLGSMVVNALEAADVRNIAVNAYPVWITYQSKDFIQSEFGDPDGGPNFKPAVFRFEIDDKVVDLQEVTLRFQSERLFCPGAPTTSLTYGGLFSAYIIKSTFYPYQIRLFINDVDVTDEFGGTWGDGTAAVDVELDISDKIINAVGGMYQNHKIEFRCNNRSIDTAYPGYTSNPSNIGSNGTIQCIIRASAIVRN